jgi:uncharacterized RDD family membrane protein YckC
LSDHNPYAPPKAEVRDAPAEVHSGELASRGLRFLASLVDAVISAFITLPLAFLTGYWQRVMAGDPDIVGLGLGITAAAFVAFVAIHGTWLAKHGQTVGKRLVGIRIVNVSDDRVPTLATTLGKRYGVLWLVSLIPNVGFVVNLVDDLLIFRSDRRCLHDLIAGTKVIMAGPLGRTAGDES